MLYLTYQEEGQLGKQMSRDQELSLSLSLPWADMVVWGVLLILASGEWKTVEGIIGSPSLEHLFLSNNYYFGWKRSFKEEQIKSYYWVYITC